MQKKKLFLPAICSVVFATVILNGCSTQSAVKNGPQSESITPQEKLSGIVELKDGDTYDLTADYVMKEINGIKYEMLAYNGSIPGPTLKVPQGAEITLNLKNNIAIPTSLHSHGVRLENRFDGVVDVLQKPVEQGKIFTYKIKFPDVGMFWYHPHLNEAYTQSHGLYGNYWVVPQDNAIVPQVPAYWSPVNEEIPIMLSDLLVEKNGLTTFNENYSNRALMGTFGNVMLVNGKTDYQKTFQQGAVVRFYITNAANTRVFNLSIPGVKIKLVGGDNGKYEREDWQDSIILSPSERAIIELHFDKQGTFTLQSMNPKKTYALATFTISDQRIAKNFSQEFDVLRENKDVIADIDAFRPYFDKKADRSITFNIDMAMPGMGGMNMMESGRHMMPNGEMMSNSGMMDQNSSQETEDQDKIEWEDTNSMMNTMSTSDMLKWNIVDDETKRKNMDIDWKFKVGDKVKIKIFNDPDSAHPMQHPFHIHGQRFLVLSANGVKNTNLVWKDTVLIPKGDTVEILVDMSNPGVWMAHCHISEHLESGMMMPFEIN